MENGNPRDAWIWGMVVLLALGFLMVAAITMIVGLATLICPTTPKRLICDPTAQRVALWLSPCALVAGLGILAAGGYRAVRAGRSAAPWQVAAWGQLMVAFLVTYSLATA